MCGRDRLLSKAAALFGASWHPWKRRDLEDQNIRGIIEVKAAKDTTNGEYREVNQVLGRLSPGNIKRVQLHGLREFPHTSCGCFQYLTFWIESLNGFGIIERNYAGEAPEGLTWNILANAAGGKQTPGIIGTSKNYLLSKRYMQGEGGFESLRWASPKAMGIVKDRLPDNNNVLIGT
jgi:acetyl-CoA decarbonylase/synthase complex subunit beta